MKTLAQIDFGNITGIGPLGKPEGNGISNFQMFISTAIGIMTIVAFVWFLFTFITGAIAIISSGGDKQAYENARKKITTGIIGVIVVIAAIFVIDLVGTIFGIPFLNITKLFNQVAGTGNVLNVANPNPATH